MKENVIMIIWGVASGELKKAKLLLDKDGVRARTKTRVWSRILKTKRGFNRGGYLDISFFSIFIRRV